MCRSPSSILFPSLPPIPIHQFIILLIHQFIILIRQFIIPTHQFIILIHQFILPTHPFITPIDQFFTPTNQFIIPPLPFLTTTHPCNTTLHQFILLLLNSTISIPYHRTWVDHMIHLRLRILHHLLIFLLASSLNLISPLSTATTPSSGSLRPKPTSRCILLIRAYGFAVPLCSSKGLQAVGSSPSSISSRTLHGRD